MSDAPIADHVAAQKLLCGVLPAGMPTLIAAVAAALTAARIEGVREGLERAAKIAETGHGYGGQSIAEFIRKALKESFL